MRTQVETINAVKHGLELANLDPARQAARLDELKKLGLVDKTATAANLISDASSTIANSRMFDVLFPDLVGVSPADKSVWVQEGLAQNPALGERISILMGAWQEGVNSFPAIATTQGEQRKVDIAAAQLRQKNAHDNMDSIISKTLKKTIKPLQRQALDTAMASGDKVAIQNILVELAGITPAEMQDIQNWNENGKKLAEYRDLKAKAGKKTSSYDAEIARLEKLVDQVKYPAGGPNAVTPPAKLDEYHQIESTIGSASFSTNLTVYQEQTDAIDNGLLQKLPKNDQEQLSELTRKDQEQSSLAELDRILDRALLETYESIESDMIDAKVAVEKQKIADATKAGRIDEAKMYTNRAKRWIEKQGDGLPEVVHMKNIRVDLNILREYGKVGTRLLIARDAGLIPQSQFDAVVNHTKSAYLTLAQMDEGAIQQLDNLANKEGVVDDYFNTIMRDYLRTRKYLKQGILGRAISYGVGGKRKIQLEDAEGFSFDAMRNKSNFELMNNEMDDLQEKFGIETIDAIFQRDTDAMRFLDKLRQKGVMSEPKLKWLVYFLMLLGGGAILGPIGMGAGILGGAGAGGGAAVGLGADVAVASGFTALGKNTGAVQ